MTQADLEPDVLHLEAIRALLIPIGVPVYSGADEIPDQPGWPYLVCWGAPGEPFGPDMLVGYGREVITRHQITAAGLFSRDVIGVLARVRNTLHRADVTIPGRRTGDIAYEANTQTSPVVDPTVRGPRGQRIHVAYATYTLCSTPDPNA